MVTEIFIRGTKLNIFTAFIKNSYFGIDTRIYILDQQILEQTVNIFYHKNFKQKRASTNFI